MERKEFTDYKDIFDENYETEVPCIPLRGLVIFPNMTCNFDIGRRKSIYSAKSAMTGRGFVFLVSQNDSEIEKPDASSVYEIGTLAVIKQLVESRGRVYRCLVQGVFKAQLLGFSARGNGYTAKIRILENYEYNDTGANELEAIKRELKSCFSEYTSLLHKTVGELADDVSAIDDPEELFEAIAFNMPFSVRVKQDLLETNGIGGKLLKLLDNVAAESEILKLEASIHEKVQNAINRNQREFYIREQIQALQEELGESPDMQGDSEEIDSYRKKLDAIENMSGTAREKLAEEIDRLAKMPSYSQEAALIRSYLDTCLSLPWDSFTEDNNDIADAQRILDEDHYGLVKVKDRIIETLAARAVKPDIKGQIICLSGPPGVGKTSIGKSIARALGRKYVRVSLGGVRDESDIRGHRKTYLGAMPGRIIAALKQAGSANPVMLLDEIDKMANDFRGDPSSAMLEVLDSEQNSQFRDHYTEIPFDLSSVLFITTANNTDTIAPPLLDRMELIELSSYTREEKFHIAREHLVPKQMKKYGLKASQMRVADSAIYAMIDSYTREAGVRKLERAIASLCRKAAKELVSGEEKISFKAGNLEKYLGTKKYLDDYYSRKPSVGCVNGLAWTSVGGVIMPLETLVLDGKGKIEITGSLGDVMKESAKIAVSTARRLASAYGISPDFYEKKDIHIHAPEGAVPKDGPSAGVTMVTSLISALSNLKVRSDVAMTGEITLTGRVLPIGGLKEKTMAAYKAGMKTVVIPEGNKGDLDEIDQAVRESVEFVLAEKIEDVLKTALITADDGGQVKRSANKGRKSKEIRPAEVL